MEISAVPREDRPAWMAAHDGFGLIAIFFVYFSG